MTEFSLELFPVMIFPPVNFCNLNGQILLRYSDPAGVISDSVNPNGSVANIAGVMNEAGNVMGLMPHPEHAVEEKIGGTDGRVLLGSLVDVLAAEAAS